MIHLDLSSLAVIVGGLGIGIGFGLQNIVSNFVSGLIILAERPIAIGHRVEVGGVAGQITKISLRSTIVVTNDNITIIVPNSNFITNPVTNWSYGDSKVRLRLPVGVAYGSDVEKLKRLLLEMAAENPAVLKEPAPPVRFLEFGDSALNFELAVWTIDMARSPTRFRSELFFAVERKLRETTSKFHFRSATCICAPAKSRSNPKAAAGLRRACNRINQTNILSYHHHGRGRLLLLSRFGDAGDAVVWDVTPRRQPDRDSGFGIFGKMFALAIRTNAVGHVKLGTFDQVAVQRLP